MSNSASPWSALTLIAAVALLPACSENDPSEIPAEQPTVSPSELLTGTSWQLERLTVLGGYVFEPESPQDYTLTFRPDGRLTGKSDCNTFQGTWQGETEEAFTFTSFGHTRSLCLTGSLHNYFMLYLGAVDGFDLTEGRLALTTPDEGVEVLFRNLQSQSPE